MDIEGVNRRLFLALNAPADLATIPLNLAIGAAKYSILVLAGIVIWRWLLGTSNDRRLLAYILIAVVPALAINYIVGLAFFHPRPFMLRLGNNYLVHAPEASFPSDHATLMWTIAFGLLYWSPSNSSSWLVALLAALTSWARVFLGVHFPLDIAGSLAVAMLSLALMTPLRSTMVRKIGGPMESLHRAIAKRLGS